MCLLISALKKDRTSLSLRMHEQTEGRRLNLKGALSNNKKKERDNAGCKNFMEYGQNSSKNSEGLDKNNKRIGGMF